LDLRERERKKKDGENYVNRSAVICRHSSLNISLVIRSWRMRWVGQVARMEKNKKSYKTLVWKHEGKGPFRIPRCR
jgi:hypothetical protein